jgi:hypothetical protein
MSLTKLQPSGVNLTANFSFANVTSTYFVGDGGLLTNISVSGGTSIVNGNSNIVVDSNGNARFSINGTSNVFVVSDTSIKTTGNVSSINANLGNLVTANYTTAVLTTGAQPNITSVGSLQGLTVSNTSGVVNFTSTANVTLGSVSNLHISGGSSGYVLSTDGSGTLSWVTQSTAAVAGSNTQVQFNDASAFGADANLTYNKTTKTLGAKNITIEATGTVSGGNLLSANYVTGTLTTGAQPNITSTGTLTDVTVSGNLTVNGTTIYANVTTLVVKDPIIEMGGNPNGVPLSSNDGKDRGEVLHYYSGGAIDAFMGWDNSNAEFAFGSDVSAVNEVMTFNTFGNVRAGYFLGNGSQLSGTIANANYSTYAGTVITAAQPNITSVGTLVNTTLGASNSLSGGNLLSANYVTGTLTTGAQPNITSTGTLSSLTVTSNVTGGNLKTAGAVIGSTLSSNIADGSAPISVTSTTRVSNLNVDYANVSDYGVVTAKTTGTFYPLLASGATTGNYALGVNNAVSFNAATGALSATLLGGTLSTAAQPNVTSLGTLSGITATGTLNFTSASNVALGAIGNVHITGGSSGQYLQTDGSGGLSWSGVTSLVGGNSNITITGNANIAISSAGNANILIVTGTGVNIAGTLNTGSGNANVGNLGTGGLIVATGNITGGNILTANSVIGSTLVSNIATGTAPLTVSSTTRVSNLNVAYANVSDYNVVTAQTTGTFYPALINSTSTGNYALGVNSDVSFNAATGALSATLLGGTLTTGAQPNITSTGTLTALTATGNVTGGNILTANSVIGSTLTSNVATGTAPFTVTSTTRVGNLNVSYSNVSDYEVVTTQSTGLFYIPFITNHSTGNYALNANSQISYNVGTGTFSASLLTGTLTTAAQPNVTSTGTLTSLTVTGNVSGGNANLGNLVTANYHSGNGSLLSSLTGGNVSGQVGNALIAGTVYTAAQPNITSVGTLVNTTMGSGNSLSGGNLLSANYVTGTLTTGAQPNITSTGALTSLSVTGTAVFGLSSDRTTYISASTSGTYSADTSTAGPIWYFTTIAGATTLNFTNVPTTDGYTTTVVAAFVNTTTVPAVQIATVAQTIKWLSGAAPTGAATGVNIYSFTLMRVNAAWVTLGQQAYYN